MYFGKEKSKILGQNMRFNILALSILLLFSCNDKKIIKNSIIEHSTEQAPPVSIENKQEDQVPLHVQTSLKLLPREQYKTYRDHYNYISEEEYFGAGSSNTSHLEDSISSGFFDDKGATGLVDSLRLNTEWLCIKFPSLDESYPRPVIDKARTISYGANNLIDFVPLTLLSVQNDDRLAYDIAFRGHYKTSDFQLLEGKNPSSQEQMDIVRILQEEITKKTAIPPRPMTTETLVLNNMIKVSRNTTVAKYSTTKSSDSDADLGNEVIFVLQNGKLAKWFAGMSCAYNIFQLRNEIYIYVIVSTYATDKTTLLKPDKDDIKEVYSNLIFGD